MLLLGIGSQIKVDNRVYTVAGITRTHVVVHNPKGQPLSLSHAMVESWF